ncbi:Protein argonaute-2-like protein [Argiope bruennichi]|uniref:Protein argonaute-2-like protein n=1 Tax=Argiope bruennichi TaxID=94029 RepID=A0A8T0FLG5_ARGBR|nr:Protein argonaute-2-like protein [Argiope bruennichi]
MMVSHLGNHKQAEARHPHIGSPKLTGRGHGQPGGLQDSPSSSANPPVTGRGITPPYRQSQAESGRAAERQQECPPPSRANPSVRGQGITPPYRQSQAEPGRAPGRQQECPPPSRVNPSVRGLPSPGISQPTPVHKPPATQPERKAVDTVSALGIELKQKLALTPALPAKPTPGKLGRPIKLIANLFNFQAPSGNIYHYDVEISNSGRSMTTRQLPPTPSAATPEEEFEGRHPAYDGMKNMYTREPLKIGKELKRDVYLEEAVPGDPRGKKKETFKITIKPVQKTETHDCAISLDPLHALFAGTVTSVPQEAVMAMETILRHGPCKHATPIGRSFYYPPLPQDIHPLGGGLEIWFGYHQSFRLGQWKPLVNINITATAFYQKGPILKFIADFLHIEDRELQQMKCLKDSDITKIGKQLKSARIEVIHLKYRRKYRVVNLTKDSAQNKIFNNTTADGQSVKMSVAQYFALNYTPLKYPNLPCIQVNPENRGIFIPIEVCHLVEGQHFRAKLDDKQSAQMIRFTSQPPKKRLEEIKETITSARFNEDPCVREFGLKVSTEPLSLEGRVLEPPDVIYKDNKKVTPHDGSWNIKGRQYLKGAKINTWVLLSFSNINFCGYPALERFAELLCRIAWEQGIVISHPAIIDIIDIHRRNIKSILTEVKDKYDANLVVIVVPANDKVVYGEIKHVAETMLGLNTQCIKDNNIVFNCNVPLVSNVCQKINAKTGGVNNTLTFDEPPSIMRKPVIIIGADVTHPGPSVEMKPSIAACVGSLDYYPFRYAVKLSLQKSTNESKESIEIILNLKEMVIELLKRFYIHTRGKKPEKILFYRDGVSEGQFYQVKQEEVKSIREACTALESCYQPGITFIVVQKRHHVRFFPEDARTGVGKMRNVPPGTTVDTTVVHPLNYDFFLCSHFGLQGTSRPAHYTVIEDDNEFGSDDLQKLTYYLCHTFGRCTRSISIPTPVQYAHLAAFRARYYLLQTISENSASSTSSDYHSISEAAKKALDNAEKFMKDTMFFL